MSDWKKELTDAVKVREDRKKAAEDKKQRATEFANLVATTFGKIQNELSKHGEAVVENSYETNSSISLSFKENGIETFKFAIEIRFQPDLGFRTDTFDIDEFERQHTKTSHQPSDNSWFMINQVTEDRIIELAIRAFRSSDRRH